MHVFGHPVDVDGLLAVVRDFGLVMVEDAAESLGSFYHSVHTGSFGLPGTLSFNGNKIVTTGGGGAIVTDDEELATTAKHLTTTATSLDVDGLTGNYQLVVDRESHRLDTLQVRIESRADADHAGLRERAEARVRETIGLTVADSQGETGARSRPAAVSSRQAGRTLVSAGPSSGSPAGFSTVAPGARAAARAPASA